VVKEPTGDSGAAGTPPESGCPRQTRLARCGIQTPEVERGPGPRKLLSSQQPGAGGGFSLDIAGRPGFALQRGRLHRAGFWPFDDPPSFMGKDWRGVEPFHPQRRPIKVSEPGGTPAPTYVMGGIGGRDFRGHRGGAAGHGTLFPGGNCSAARGRGIARGGMHGFPKTAIGWANSLIRDLLGSAGPATGGWAAQKTNVGWAGHLVRGPAKKVSGNPAVGAEGGPPAPQGLGPAGASSRARGGGPNKPGWGESGGKGKFPYTCT